MGLRVSGKNVDIGDALRTYAQTKITATVAKYFDGAATGHVTIEPDGSAYRTECTLHLSSGVTLQTESKGHDIYACFDQAAARLEKRLRRHKDRLKSRHHPSESDAGIEAVAVANYVVEGPSEDWDGAGEFTPVTVAETRTNLKRMSVSAAILELDLSGAPVLVFTHAGHGRVNVVYRRADGNVGWVDPETLSK